jgi:hypothetical protein
MLSVFVASTTFFVISMGGTRECCKNGEGGTNAITPGAIAKKERIFFIVN